MTLHFHRFKRINNFLAMIDDESIHVNEKMFTWKKRIHTHLIYERLDRSIARKDWSSIHPNA